MHTIIYGAIKTKWLLDMFVKKRAKLVIHYMIFDSNAMGHYYSRAKSGSTPVQLIKAKRKKWSLWCFKFASCAIVWFHFASNSTRLDSQFTHLRDVVCNARCALWTRHRKNRYISLLDGKSFFAPFDGRIKIASATDRTTRDRAKNNQCSQQFVSKQ